MNISENLLNHPIAGVRAASAYRMNDIELSILSQDECPTVRGAVANSTTNPEILALLAHDEDKYVRISVARNPYSDGDTLHVLSKEKSISIKFWVALAHNAHGETLDYLYHSGDECIINALSMNPSTPQDTLWLIAENYCGNYSIIKSIFNNTNAPDELLVWMHVYCNGPIPQVVSEIMGEGQ